MRNVHWRVVAMVVAAGIFFGLASGDWRYGIAAILGLAAAIYGVRSDK